ncbi:uncharacterized protein K02A2.6 [Trichonephila clavipes]|nr:uncharacterized protein K02A2.6 [Trichonephila clavipes]
MGGRGGAEAGVPIVKQSIFIGLAKANQQSECPSLPLTLKHHRYYVQQCLARMTLIATYSVGIIEKVDSSEWATPVVPVVKSDGSIRLCADYSVTLNPNLIVPQHPLPRLDEIFGSLNGGKQFTKLDFKHAYLQMKVHPDSQKLMTINTHKGLYICKRLMYGLNGAPAIWHSMLTDYFMDGVKVFMDDARITGSDEISHFTALEEFLRNVENTG